MRCTSRFRVSTLHAITPLLALLVSCSGNSQPGATGTSGTEDAPFAIEISQTYITLENRTGSPLVGGQMEIVPRGILPPFRTTLPRLENGMRRDLLFNSFRTHDGTPFRRGMARARSVKITAKDIGGKTYAAELPFE